MRHDRRTWIGVSLLLSASLPTVLHGQAIQGHERAGQPNVAGHLDQPLRYRPDAGAFRILNGKERFNRPLYGGNTAFRVDGGDRPEFAIYLPGRGGNLRFAIQSPKGLWWLHDAHSIETRYLPGELSYAIRDPRLGHGTLHLHVIADFATEALLLEASGDGLSPSIRLLWAFGGVNGERGRRDGDIGTEAVPIRDWFQPQARFAQGNAISHEGQSFDLISNAASIHGAVAHGRVSGISSADLWDDPERLFAPTVAQVPKPIAIGTLDLTTRPNQLALQVLAHKTPTGELADYRAVKGNPEEEAAPPPLLPAYRPQELPSRFKAARAEAARRRTMLRVSTPDPYLDTAVGALNIATDANWDDDAKAIMHGAIAWRAKLLGWRGPYALDALGWHDRAALNIRGWLPQQNISPVPAQIPPPDENANLARSEAALHANGDISHSHYDMNTVFIDALFRHLDWTGDRALAQEAWPVIQRHLAWQKRLFRRTFDASGLPLYESYAQIWASDDIHYGGGGTAYGSAYNAFLNHRAAQLATLLGHDGRPYEEEAQAIRAGMRSYLWDASRGAFAEYKDSLGAQLVHPSAGLWSYYHVLDSQLLDATSAWTATGAMLRHVPRLPVTGPGVPVDRPYQLFSTSDWMPYTWSVNNVVMGENAHAALALWQAGRSQSAYTLLKAAILASMYMGITPGNVGTLNYLDVYRRESQRDFADGAGTVSRAIVEGLFGVHPDALNRRLVVSPGLPGAWNRASIHHVDFALSFARDAKAEHWTLHQSGRLFDSVTWRLPVRTNHLTRVTANGRPVRWKPVEGAVGHPSIELTLPFAQTIRLDLVESGAAIRVNEDGNALMVARSGDFSWLAASAGPSHDTPDYALADQTPPAGLQEAIDLSPYVNGRLTAIFEKGKYRAPRGKGASLGLPSQGIGAWAGFVQDMADIDDTGLRAQAARHGGWFTLPDGGRFKLATAGSNDTAFVSQWNNAPASLTIPLSGSARYLRLLMAGTTNAMQSRLDNGEVVVTYKDGSTSRLPLHNPSSWWPVQQDYLIDDYQFRLAGARPLRVDLKTAKVRLPTGSSDARIPGGSATVLGLRLDPSLSLANISFRALAQDVVIGTLGATLIR